MKQTIGTLYTGFDGVGVGAKAAGLELAWGLEILPQVAEVANANLGGHVRVGNILEADPYDFDYVDVMHASTKCISFSQANSNAGETAEDIAHARKTSEFITVLKPQIFTLENVSMYRFSKSMRTIEDALYGAGYWIHIELVNMADYGVPQTRKRLILRAVRGGFVPHLPSPINEWRSWYSAVADLLDDMPECELAPWQLKLMPSELTTMLIGNQSAGDNRDSLSRANFDMPAMTLTTKNSRNLKAVLIDSANATPTNKLSYRNDKRPAFTMVASMGGKFNHRILRDSGRVLQLSMRAAARLQSFPDWYQLPDSREMAGFGIGNSVPPLMMEQIYRGLLTT